MFEFFIEHNLIDIQPDSRKNTIGDIMKIVYKLYEIRTQKGMRLRKLEELSGIGKSTINRIENGEANPTVDIICQLAVALGCQTCDLFQIE